MESIYGRVPDQREGGYHQPASLYHFLEVVPYVYSFEVLLGQRMYYSASRVPERYWNLDKEAQVEIVARLDLYFAPAEVLSVGVQVDEGFSIVPTATADLSSSVVVVASGLESAVGEAPYQHLWQGEDAEGWSLGSLLQREKKKGL